nr:uncharacterized protein LOC111503269 [Leptinotarsa decemlineata]
MYPTHEYKMGLKTKVSMQNVQYQKNIHLIEETDGGMDINSVLTLATVSTGNGYSTVNEMLSVLNVPFMSNSTYQQHHENVADIIEETAWKVMEEAGQEEARIAQDLGEIVKDDLFWTNDMKPKLEISYMACLLPELIDPRYLRKLEISNPPRQ